MRVSLTVRSSCTAASSWFFGVRLIVALIATLGCFCIAPVRAWAVDDAIVYPSVREATIVPARDFYIIGTAENAATRGVLVEVFAGSDISGTTTPVRSLQYSNTTNLVTAKDQAVPVLDNYYNPGIPESDLLMPDLSYNPLVAGSNLIETNKISAGSKNFSALIYGGRSDSLGVVSGAPLAAGSYTIKVTLGINTTDTSDDVILSQTINLSASSDKVMGRFSPANHQSAMMDYANSNAWRVYLDPFPGYWSPENMKCIYYNSSDTPYTESDVFLESCARWRLADAMEYEQGTVHCCLYNISPTSATQTVEMGIIQYTERIDSDLECFYYTLGEPSLTVQGQTITAEQMYQTMDAGDKLVFTRGELARDAGEDNRFACYLDHDVELDTNLSDGLVVKEGDEFALFGVTAPIQNDTNIEVTRDNKYAYSITRHIATIKYSFVKDGEEVLVVTKPVELVRDFSETWTGQKSLYEFKHAFATGSSDGIDVQVAGSSENLAAGKYTITATALDTNGDVVAGGEEALTLVVQSPIPPTPSNPEDGTSLPKTGDSFGFLSMLILAMISTGYLAAELQRELKN